MYIRNKSDRFALGENDDVNPMDYLSNLSDVMLVLAVGIMLALVAAFHVNLNGEDQGAYAAAAVSGQTQIEVPLEAAQNTGKMTQEALDQAGYTEYGTVYTDRKGHLYVLGVPDED